MPASTESTSRDGLPALLLLAAALLLLGIGIAGFWPWISDDSFIALQYSQRLIEGHGLTWNDGPPVEGYSNLLWILLCAAVGLTGLDWVLIVRGLGIAATIATFVVLLRTPLLRAAGHAPRAVVLLLAGLAPVSLWAIGGLEGPLTMLLVTIVYVKVGEALADPEAEGATRACRAAGLWLFVLALCRSEGPLWGGFAGLMVLLFARRGPAGERHVLWRRLLWLGVPMTIAVLGHLVFRLGYYGEWVPNTAHAKLATSPKTLDVGLFYLSSASAILRSLWVPALLGFVLALFDRRVRGLALLSLAAVVTWTSYVGTIGGDWYPLCRYLQGAYGVLVLLLGIGLVQLSRWPIGRWLAWGLIGAAVVLARVDARLDSSDPYQQISSWEWRGRAVGEWLGRAFGARQPLLALDPAGTVPFYSGLPCLDMLGLCDSTIAKTPPPRPDHVIPAHSRGNPGYVLDQQPDLLLFGTPVGDLGPRWPGGWQMEEEQPRFLTDYLAVICRTGPVSVVGEGERDIKITMRVRRQGRLGVQRDGEQWTVPGLLLTGHRQPVPFHEHEPHRLPQDPAVLGVVAQAALAMKQWWEREAAVVVLDAGGEVVGEVRKPGPLRLEAVELPAGDYALEVEPPAPVGIRFVVRPHPGTAGERRGGLLHLPRAGRVDVIGVVEAAAALPWQLRAVRLRRQPPR